MTLLYLFVAASAALAVRNILGVRRATKAYLALKARQRSAR